MSDFERFKAASSLLAESANSATSFEQLAMTLLKKRDSNPFHSFDYLAYMTSLENAITTGIEATIAIIDGTENDA